ncbi:hypothetical protein Rhopal_005961-T1 [Rhodotorula paludigena]|uniref:Uncharacterized protein n=1 Tax=Rhodotorula paludigena TaxID=86838 RepID=A0AAV5GWG6_9BASI|nr:hypothetical protein Rhopal_005961-T1 [Rhodotorula paludigena]
MTERRIDWHTMMMDDDGEVRAEHPVFFQYLEATEREQDTMSPDAWHNPMMRVDEKLDAEHAFASLPHWQWIDDSV